MSAVPQRPLRRWMLRRLAIVILVLVTLLMGALGWILGRPGVLRPESQALAAPTNERAARPTETGAGGGEAQSASMHSARGE